MLVGDVRLPSNDTLIMYDLTCFNASALIASSPLTAYSVSLMFLLTLSIVNVFSENKMFEPVLKSLFNMTITVGGVLTAKIVLMRDLDLKLLTARLAFIPLILLLNNLESLRVGALTRLFFKLLGYKLVPRDIK